MYRFILLALLVSPLSSAAETDSERIHALENRISKLEGAPAKTSISAFNPAIGMAIDTAFLSTNGRGDFQFRAAELNVESPIDPYLKGWAVITGSNQTNPAVDVEEAALETTSLPHSLTVTGGRVFAPFGRLAHFHDHELPVIQRPLSLDSYIGGETRADGVQVNYLLPTNFYLNATAGMYDKIGTNNTRQDPTGSRTLYEFTYFGRLNTYRDLTDSQSVEIGVDCAWAPKRTVADTAGLGIKTVKNTWRTLSGVDLTYRYQPSQGGLYRGLLWGTEVMQNDERRFNPNTMLPTDRVRSYAGFTHIEAKMGLHWRPGILMDVTEDLDQAHKITKTLTPHITYDVTEFQRLRLAYSYAWNNVPHSAANNTIGLQWTGILGHHVHGFRDR